MSYLVLARKYRPQSFSDLVGQEHVSRTLRNGILQGRVAHAFLFTGARGVGKTTSARLLAKCLNCLGADGLASGPVTDPCGTCSACVEITQGVDMDVQEIDGASYNGIDEVRRLQETMGYRPARDRFKVYVVDEVHMLSNSAWNAFLKTLEEPPSHVKFIFATTEIQKVPITILSRCQRYDFRLVSVTQIAQRLQQILEQESVSANEEALRMIARQAGGSMRDALSLLDQVLAYAMGPLAEADVATVLGVADRASCARAAQAVLLGQAQTVLAELNTTLAGGADLTQFARDLLEYFRDAVAAKVSNNPELFELPAYDLATLQAFVVSHEASDLARVFHGFSVDFERVVRSHAPRFTLEMSLVKLASRAPLLPVDELLVRLRDLERRLVGKAGPPGPLEPASPTAFFPVPAGEIPRETKVEVIPDAPKRGVAASLALATTVPAEAIPSTLFAAPPMLDETTPIKFAPPPSPPIRAVRNQVTRAVAPSEQVHFEMPPEARWSDGEGAKIGTPQEPAQEALSSAPKAPDFVTFGKELSAADEAVVRALVDALRTEAPVLASAIENAWISEVRTSAIVLAFPQGSFLGAGIDELGKTQLANAAALVLGEGGNVAIVSHLLPKDTATSLAERDAQARYNAELEVRRCAEQHPLVQHAVQVLRARVRHVRIQPKE